MLEQYKMSGDRVATKAIELELLEVKNRLGETVINMGSTICLKRGESNFLETWC